MQMRSPSATPGQYLWFSLTAVVAGSFTQAVSVRESPVFSGGAGRGDGLNMDWTVLDRLREVGAWDSGRDMAV